MTNVYVIVQLVLVVPEEFFGLVSVLKKAGQK